MVNEILSDLKKLTDLAIKNNLLDTPKAIYVCKTNLLEIDRFEKDEIDVAFEQRQAPPILI
jgi:type III restriction enzyme